MESYVYLALITGEEPDAERATRVIHARLPDRQGSIDWSE